MAISSARQFFDQAVAGGPAFLESLVAERTHETEWLDFKGGDDIGDGQVKSLWTKAICGFANNQGGCIVWGIDARRDPETDVDAANAVKHVPDPAALRSRLTQLHPGATEPPLIGVESVAIQAEGSAGPGFVVRCCKKCQFGFSTGKAIRLFQLVTANNWRKLFRILTVGGSLRSYQTLATVFASRSVGATTCGGGYFSKSALTKKSRNYLFKAYAFTRLITLN